MYERFHTMCRSLLETNVAHQALSLREESVVLLAHLHLELRIITLLIMLPLFIVIVAAIDALMDHTEEIGVTNLEAAVDT